MNTEKDFIEPKEEMEARLWAYIDGFSDESPLIEKLVTENREWQEKYAELLELHQLVERIQSPKGYF